MSAPEWSPPTTEQIRAANDLVDAIVAALRTDEGVHAETAISSAARLAGTFLLRSLGLDLSRVAPGAAVFSNGANERGPLLLQTLMLALAGARVAVDASPRSWDIPPGHASHLDTMQARARLWPPARDIFIRAGLDDEQAAHACALATGRLIAMTASVLDPEIGLAIAAYGFVEGAKTTPAAT